MLKRFTWAGFVRCESSDENITKKIKIALYFVVAEYRPLHLVCVK